METIKIGTAERRALIGVLSAIRLSGTAAVTASERRILNRLLARIDIQSR